MKIKCDNILCDHSVTVSLFGWLIDYIGLLPECLCKRCQQRFDRFERRINAEVSESNAFTLNPPGEDP